jgi:hypothetical protein
VPSCGNIYRGEAGARGAHKRASVGAVGAVLVAAVLEEGEVEGEAVECGRGGGRGTG